MDMSKLDGASRKYYEAMQRADQHELEMLDRLIAEKQARESQATTGTTTTSKKDSPPV